MAGRESNSRLRICVRLSAAITLSVSPSLPISFMPMAIVRTVSLWVPIASSLSIVSKELIQRSLLLSLFPPSFFQARSNICPPLA